MFQSQTRWPRYAGEIIAMEVGHYPTSSGGVVVMVCVPGALLLPSPMALDT